MARGELGVDLERPRVHFVRPLQIALGRVDAARQRRRSRTLRREALGDLGRFERLIGASKREIGLGERDVIVGDALEWLGKFLQFAEGIAGPTGPEQRKPKAVAD